MTDTQAELDLWLRDARKRVSATTFAPSTEQVGRVEAVADGIARVSGLPNVRLNEVVRFERGQVGFALTLDRNVLGCVLLDDTEGVEAGDRVDGSGGVVRVPVGPALLGRTIDPLGRPLDEGGTSTPKVTSPWSVLPPRSSIVISSANPSRPAYSSSMPCLPWGAASAS